MTHRPTTSRRDFLRLGLAAGPASLVAACGWDGGAFLEPRLRAFSRLNDWVGEKILLFGETTATIENPGAGARDTPAYQAMIQQLRARLGALSTLGHAERA